MTVKTIVTDILSLTQECNPFDFNDPIQDPIELSRDLADTMIANKGLGLAAPQIGVNARVLVISSNPVIVMFNPLFVDISQKQTTLDEGCLSFPGIVVPISRPETIKVRYRQPNGETVTEKFNGMTARTIQHELDHLNGILFYSRTSLYYRQKTKRKIKL